MLKMFFCIMHVLIYRVQSFIRNPPKDQHENMNGVVLYSGRWRLNVDSLVHNHRQFLVDPYRLDVVVVGFPSNICNMNRFVFHVNRAWNLSTDRLLVLKHRDREVSRSRIEGLSVWKQQQLSIWEVQFYHVRIAFLEALKWKNHDVFIRARIDRLFTSTLAVPFAQNCVFGIVSDRGWSADRNVSILRDWFYVTDVHGMDAITNTSFTIIDRSIRCFATCPEEQVMLHIRNSHIPVVPLSVDLQVVPKNSWCTGPMD